MELSKASDLGVLLKIFILLSEWKKLILHWRFICDYVAGIIARKLASDAIRNSIPPPAFKSLNDLTRVKAQHYCWLAVLRLISFTKKS